jgi:hypothetical protein
LKLCTAIKPNGERCKARATPPSEWCWNHDPTHVEEQRRNGRQGGKRAGRGRPVADLARLQERLEGLAEDVLEGRAERGKAAVAGQLFQAARACVRDRLKAIEQEELVARLEHLEEVLEANREDQYA